MEADLQEVRGEDARSVPSTFFPRCVQRSGIGQASLSGIFFSKSEKKIKF